MKSLASIRIVLLIIFSLSLLSCGMLHKVTHKSSDRKIETERKNLDSAGSTRLDSTSVKVIDSASMKKKEEIKTSDISIEFADSSVHNKVEVITDSAGRNIIKAEGNIKSVKVHKKEQKKNIASSHVAKKDTAAVSNQQQTKVKDKGSSVVDHSSKVVAKEKKDRRLPWYGYLILILVIFFILLFLFVRYKHNIIAWFISLKNPGMKVYYDPKLKGYQMIDKNITKDSS